MCALMAEDNRTHSELATFGEELRREREIRGISLKEISDSTKISKRFLEAIENNDHRTLPAPVFTRGFVREYARYLGLNAEEMVTRYNYAAAGDDRIEQSSHLQGLVRPPESPEQAKGIPRTRIDRNVVFLVAIIAALLLVTLWALRFRRDMRAEAVDTVAHAAPVPKAKTSVAPAISPAAPAGLPAPHNDDNLHMTIDLTDDSWITLEADGKTIISDELKRGDHRTVDAHDTFRLKLIGNAGGVALTLNNVRIGTLGKDGRVIHNRIYDRQWLKSHTP